jgi:hypothetical protein
MRRKPSPATTIEPESPQRFEAAQAVEVAAHSPLPASEDLTVEQPDPGDENFEEDTEPSDSG